MGIGSVAVYSEIDRDAPHVREADEAFLIGPAVPAESYLNVLKIIDTAKRGRRRGDPSRLRLPRRERRLRPRLRRGRDRLHRPAAGGDRGDGLEDAGARDHGRGRGADRARRDRAAPRTSTRRAQQAEEAGYPVACKAAGGGGGKGFRVAMTPDDLAGGLRGRRPRGREVLLRLARLRRALPRGPAPRRGPGARRLARQRDPPRRARLLDPAPPPEGDRGGARPPASTPRCASGSARSPPTRPPRSATARPARSRGCRSATSTSSSR